MILHKCLISFIAAFAVATSVTASATPVVRGGGSECNTGTLQCCDSTAYSDDPIVGTLDGLADTDIPVGASIPLGIACYGILVASSCTAQPVCCDNVSQHGLINVGCTPVNIGL